jgi:hypothetical protein
MLIFLQMDVKLKNDMDTHNIELGKDQDPQMTLMRNG